MVMIMVNYLRLLKEKDISILTASKIMDIPYSSLYAIFHGKTDIYNCKYETAYKIAAFFNLSMDDLVLPKGDFQYFRNTLHHYLKSHGDIDTYRYLLDNKLIQRYFLHDENIRALYLVALAEYIENKHSLEKNDVVNQYHDTALAQEYAIGHSVSKRNNAPVIAEFKRHNILEGNLYDAV